MAVGVRFVPVGPPALAVLSESIAAVQSADPLAQVTVVAPSARAAIHLRRSLISHRAAASRPSGLANVTFVTTSRLAEVIGGPALSAVGLRRLSRTTLASTVRAVLAAHPGSLGVAASHPATVSEVTERYEELRFAPDGLDGVSGLAGRAAELLWCCREVRRRVDSFSYDDVDLFAAASDALADGSGGSEAPYGSIIVHLLERCRPAEAAFFQAFGRCGDVVVHLGLTGDEVADDLALELGELLGPTDPLGVMHPIGRRSIAELLVAPSPTVECRVALRQVMEHLERGVRPDQIAICYASREPYLALLTSECAAAGLDFTASLPDPLASQPTARFILAFMDLAQGPLRREALMALLRTAPLIGSDGHRVPVGEWDRVTRLAGLVEGSAEQWRFRLAELATYAGQARTEGGPTASSSRIGHQARTLLAVAGLQNFLADLQAELVAIRSASGWRALVGAVSAAIERFVGAASVRRGGAAASAASDELVESLLAELSSLDDIEGDIGLPAFSSIIAEELRRPGPRRGRLGSGVIVAPLEQLHGLALELVVVVGCIEGNLPGHGARSPFLSSQERQQLGLEATSATAVAKRDHRLVQLALRASDELVAIAPVLDSSGRMVVPSRLLGENVAVRALPGLVGSLASVVAGATAVNPSELETALLFEMTPAELDVSGPTLLGRDELALPIGSVIAVESGEFGGHSGRINAASQTGELAFSPTTLEEYASCPFRYFVSHRLAVESVDPPEQRFEIDPRDRGLIVHEVLERFVAEEIASPIDSPRPGAERLRAIAIQVIERYERFGRTGKRAIFELESRRLLRALESERRSDELARLTGEVRPMAVEHGFGSGDVAPVVVSVGGRSVSFRGKIDRIDTGDDAVVVIDYKTGRPDRFRVIETDPVDAGRHLQLPVYALAAAAATGRPDASVRAAFRFIGAEPAEISIELDAQTTKRFHNVLGVLVDAIDSGAFPFRPGPAGFGGPENCTFCDFDRLCPPDRARRWERARGDAALVDYVELIDPAIDAQSDDELVGW